MLKVIYLMADLKIEGKFTRHRSSLKGEKQNKNNKKGLTQHFTTLSNLKLWNKAINALHKNLFVSLYIDSRDQNASANVSVTDNVL